MLPFKKITVPRTSKERKKTLTTTDQPPISVDFEELQQMNPEIIGWLYCEDTPINYPVLQTTDNSKYLKMQPDGKTARSGSIFVDCNCESDFSSDNNIVYGHNRRNGMFSCLPKYEYQTYYKDHPVMWLLTPDKNYRIDLFAGFATLAADWVYEINLYPERLRNEYLDRCLKSSDFKSDIDPHVDCSIITLSTCHYNGIDDARYVVMGTLAQCKQ